MKGNIYTQQTCPLCGGKLVNDENRRGCFCPHHPQEVATGGFWVAFGRGHFKRFKTYGEAYRHLTGLRFQTDHDDYDARDWHRDHPLGFETLSRKWLEHKANENIKPSTIGNLTREIGRAITRFGQKNIKTISTGEIEDFIFADHHTPDDRPVSSKTRARSRISSSPTTKPRTTARYQARPATTSQPPSLSSSAGCAGVRRSPCPTSPR
jgi:hypothetical protein